MTNRQWLETLSDEEFIQQIYYENFECNTCAYPLEESCKSKDCNCGHLEWLKAEHKESEQ